MYCGVKRSGVIAVSSANIIGAVDRKEDLELALIDKIMDESMDKGTERLEGAGVMKRGVGFGNVRSNST